MSIFKNTFSYFLIGLVVFAFNLSGCQTDDNEPAPELPPQSSFVMDFEDFSNDKNSNNERNVATNENWSHAYVNVAVWNTILIVGLASPVASFREAFNHDAVYHPDTEDWTWSYNVPHGGSIYEAELTAYLEDTMVVWEMRLTKDNEYTDFLWYHGKSQIDGTNGYWILLDNPANTNDFLRIDWNQDFNGTADIKYTNIVPGAVENGSYIYYGTNLEDFDRYYDIYGSEQDNMVEIDWNHNNQNGRVKNPDHFADDNWHCWDENLEDINCP